MSKSFVDPQFNQKLEKTDEALKKFRNAANNYRQNVYRMQESFLENGKVRDNIERSLSSQARNDSRLNS